MNRVPGPSFVRWFVRSLVLFTAVLACSTNPTATDAWVAHHDATADRPDVEWTPPDLAADLAADRGARDLAPGDHSPTKLSRGWKWVRNNPMMLSGLTVSMGPPPATAVAAYFDEFNATAVHLWETGLPVEMDGWGKAGHPSFRFIVWTLPDGTSRARGQLLGGYPASAPGRIGFQVSDEPATLAALQQIDVGMKALRAYDPDALIYVNFGWNGEPKTTQLLSAYCSQMDGDIISYDWYRVEQKTYQALERFRAAGLACGKPYWRYLRAYHTPGKEPKNSESDLRWDAYASLTYGYTGLSWFLYQIIPSHNLAPAFFTQAGSFTAAKTSLYAVAGALNVELRNTGRAITQLTSTDVRYVASLLQPFATKAWSPGAGQNPYLAAVGPAPGQLFLDLLVGFFDDDAGERYVMVQNVRHQNGDFPLNNALPGTARLGFDFSSAPSTLDQTQVKALDRLTGKVTSVPLTALGGGKAQLDVKLAAGDAVLFKFATGKPFALGT